MIFDRYKWAMMLDRLELSTMVNQSEWVLIFDPVRIERAPEISPNGSVRTIATYTWRDMNANGCTS
jgi:hypothetical protein